MAQVIKIKRSSSTATPTSLAQGELAYSGEDTSNKLFIGNPGTGDVTVIGGRYFTDMLDHTAGTLTASSAIIVDSSSKIDVLNVDNITLDGNAITSTNTGGNLTLTPNGAGNLVLDGVNWPQADGSNGNVLTTDGSGQASWTAPAASSFTLSDGTNTDTFNTGETLTFTGGTDITTTVSDNEITFAYSGQTPAIYDNAGTPALETGITAAEVRTLIGVDSSGTDNSTNVTLNTTSHDYLSLSGQEITLGAIDLTTDVTGDLPITEGGTGASTAAQARTNLGVDVAGTDNSTDVTLNTASHDYLSLSGQQIILGAVDLATDVTGVLPITGLASNTTTIGSTSIQLGTTETAIEGLTSLEVDNLSLDGSTITTTDSSDLTLGDGSGVDVIVAGNLTVQGTTTSVNSTEVNIGDNILVLNSGASGVPSANAGLEVERGDSTNVALRWHENTDRWQVTVNGTDYFNVLTDDTTVSYNIDGGTF